MSQVTKDCSRPRDIKNDRVKICSAENSACCRKDPFQFTATGIIGARRESMLTNELLLRSDISKSQTRGYTKSGGAGFAGDAGTYGARNVRRDGGVAAAIGQWRSGKLSSPRQRVQDKDFVAMNRAAAISGIATQEENRQFRLRNDIRIPAERDRMCLGAPFEMDPCVTYGHPPKISDPIGLIVEHRYQDEWFSNRVNRKDRCDLERRLLAANRLPEVNLNRAYHMKAYQIPVRSGDLWKMPKFSRNSEPHLSTFADEKTKREAMLAASYDGITRRGCNNVGAYTQAQK